MAGTTSSSAYLVRSARSSFFAASERQDGELRRRLALDLGVSGLRRELYAIERGLQIALSLLRVGVEVELDDHDGEPLRGSGLDRLDPLHAVYGVLDGLRDLLVHQIRPDAGDGGRDGYDRERDVGQELLVELSRGVCPTPDEQQGSQDNDGFVPQTPAYDPLHQFTSVPAPKLSANSLSPLTKASASSSVILLIAF